MTQILQPTLLASSEGRALAAWTQVQCLCHRRWDSAHGLTWNVKACCKHTITEVRAKIPTELGHSHTRKRRALQRSTVRVAHVRQQRILSDVRPDIARCVDEERLPALGRGQQIRVGLDRPGGQHMQVHAVNPRAFPRRAIVKTPGHFPWTVFAKTRPARSPVTLPPSRATRPFTMMTFMPSEW